MEECGLQARSHLPAPGDTNQQDFLSDAASEATHCAAPREYGDEEFESDGEVGLPPRPGTSMGNQALREANDYASGNDFESGEEDLLVIPQRPLEKYNLPQGYEDDFEDDEVIQGGHSLGPDDDEFESEDDEVAQIARNQTPL